jgi:hypothetical protein
MGQIFYGHFGELLTKSSAALACAEEDGIQQNFDREKV